MAERRGGGGGGRGGTGLDAAVAFLTPLGGAVASSPRAVPWFPAVGAAIGVGVGAVWYWSDRAFGPLIGAVLAVVADLFLTGMLHMDGLADSADGLLPHVSAGAAFYGGPMGRRDPVARAADAARRLEIMADSSTGAFGTIAVVAVALCRVTALRSLGGNLASSVLLTGCLWCSSRAVMSLGLTVLPYARAEGGLASGFDLPSRPSGRGTRSRSSPIRVRNGWALAASLLALACAGTVLVHWHPLQGAAAFGIGTLAGIGVLCFACRRLGGFTGDVLGAAGVVLETVGLLAAAAHWGAL